jgi:hypothetical protein
MIVKLSSYLSVHYILSSMEISIFVKPVLSYAGFGQLCVSASLCHCIGYADSEAQH